MFKLICQYGVCFFKSTLLKSPHGFSTRIGGVSTLEHTSSLNLAFGRGDDEETVLKNVFAFANAIGVDGGRIISVPQVHSNDVKTVDMSHSGFGVIQKADFSCDGYVTDASELPIGVKTADCVPILIEGRDDTGRVVAVSAVHAGWRGTASKIVAVAIRKISAYGVKPENIYVAIGPCIDECCYEVKRDFSLQIAEKLGQNYELKYIKRNENGSLFASLKGMNLEIISECGIPRENVDVSTECTCCNSEFFYSHRRQNGIRGAMLNIIAKKQQNCK